MIWFFLTLFLLLALLGIAAGLYFKEEQAVPDDPSVVYVEWGPMRSGKTTRLFEFMEAEIKRTGKPAIYCGPCARVIEKFYCFSSDSALCKQITFFDANTPDLARRVLGFRKDGFCVIAVDEVSRCWKQYEIFKQNFPCVPKAYTGYREKKKIYRKRGSQ